MSRGSAAASSGGVDTGFVEVRGERVRLRRFRRNDLAAFVAYRADADVARYQSWGQGYDEAQGVEFVEWATSTDPGVAGEWFQFAVERLDEPGLIGDVAANFGADIEIGYTFAPGHQGRGYATEAVGLLLDYLSRRGVTRVVAWADVDNIRSIAVLRRLGFGYVQREGNEDQFRLDLTPVRAPSAPPGRRRPC